MPTAYVTVPLDRAESIARSVVEERLAAAVNSVPCTSTFWWEGEIEYRDEAVLLATTTDDRYDELVDRILELHPYDVPCVLRFDETDVHPAFAEWRSAAVGRRAGK